jgi:hypothetical protein
MSTDRQERHCIVGAGFSGLAIAAALKRAGIAYDHLEADDQVGGNWYHGVYETVHIISSKKTTEYTDFPMPDDYPDFPSAKQMNDYLNAYTDHWGLREHIEFNTKVNLISPLDGDLWEIALESGEKRVYGGVVVCNGHHWDCRYPEYPGEFTGEVFHSKQYKNPEVLKGKRVLVVGAGNSGCDIAVEAARFGIESHISIRRPVWILPQTIGGVPMVQCLKPWMLGWMQNLSMRIMLRIVVGPYSQYGLEQPDYPVFARHPTINSQFLYALKHGKLKVHKDVKRLEGKTVEFVDGTKIEVDLIAYATGFHVSVPFVAPDVIQWKNGYPDLLAGIFSPRYKNFYVVGIGQPRYGAGPLLTVGAKALAVSILTQRKMKMPIGAMMAKLGQKPLNNYLMDPHKMLRDARKMIWMANKLPLIERLFFRKGDTKSGTPGTKDTPVHGGA